MFSIVPSFGKYFEKTSFINRFGNQFNEDKILIERKITNSIPDIQADSIKNMTTLEKKISSIESRQTYFMARKTLTY